MLQHLLNNVYWLLTALTWVLFATVLTFCLRRDAYTAETLPEKVRHYIRSEEFDFVDWTLQALVAKGQQGTLNEQHYLTETERAMLVREYFELRGELEDVTRQIADVYGDPKVLDAEAASAELRAQEAELRALLAERQTLAEAILQEQIATIAAEQGLTVGGQPVPGVAFHFTAVPMALIISPREVIRQEINTDVSGELTLEEQIALEDEIAQALDVSTLLVPLGGIGTYPAMVYHSSYLNGVVEVSAHEWTHNYLTPRPLGFNYLTSGELRTMNETTAEIAGRELAALVVARYYPDLLPPDPPFLNFWRRGQMTTAADAAPSFDFNTTMRQTRLTVDRLLSEGKVLNAEAYMEAQRRVFWERGYHHLRKLNQAYFAFYGAYNVGNSGAGGGDPVGAAVRLVRRRSPNLTAFLNTMAQFDSYAQLEAYIKYQSPPPTP